MGAVADEIPGEPAAGREIGEGLQTGGALELSSNDWTVLFARLVAGDAGALEALY